MESTLQPGVEQSAASLPCLQLWKRSISRRVVIGALGTCLIFISPRAAISGPAEPHPVQTGKVAVAQLSENGDGLHAAGDRTEFLGIKRSEMQECGHRLMPWNQLPQVKAQESTGLVMEREGVVTEVHFCTYSGLQLTSWAFTGVDEAKPVGNGMPFHQRNQAGTRGHTYPGALVVPVLDRGLVRGAVGGGGSTSGFVQRGGHDSALLVSDPCVDSGSGEGQGREQQKPPLKDQVTPLKIAEIGGMFLAGWAAFLGANYMFDSSYRSKYEFLWDLGGGMVAMIGILAMVCVGFMTANLIDKSGL